MALLITTSSVSVYGNDNDEEDEDVLKELEKDEKELEGDLVVAHDHGVSDDERSQKSTTSIGFVHAFLASLSMIIVSEIGDKTFFIAAILAMKHSRWLVFGGAISALGFMTFLSVCLGYATVIIPRALTFYVCTGLLAIFGVKMLYEGYNMSSNEGQEEFEEVSAELKTKEALQDTTASDLEKGQLIATPPLHRRYWCLMCLAPIFFQSFTLTFLAEWGDRSQLATIILAAREDPLGVVLGGTFGHALCTAMAVLGGKIIAQRISVKTVTLIGGVVFLIFALSAFFQVSEDMM